MKKIMFDTLYRLLQAVISGYKIMTRRIIKLPKNACGMQVTRNNAGEITGVYACDENGRTVKPNGQEWKILPRYKVGEIVALSESYFNDSDGVYYRLEAESLTHDAYKRYLPYVLLAGIAKWKNKMYMRSALCRYYIKILSVRAERLQDISDEDCIKEGIMEFPYVTGSIFKNKTYGYGYNGEFNTPREAFASLIDKINGKGIWNSNPYVWVYEFELVK